MSGREFYLDKEGNELPNVIYPNTSNPTSSSTSTNPPASSCALINALRNSRWLEHNVTINGEKVYLEFESNGRVRTRTSSNMTGFVASNETWFVDGGVLYMQLKDPVTGKVRYESSGTLKGNRIEGKDKNLTTGSSSKWLLTKIE